MPLGVTVDASSPEDFRSDELLLAACLAALAGWIDATGYIMYRGLFLSFMSGNTTRVAVGLGVDNTMALNAGRAVVVFVGGVVIGELVGQSSGRWGRSLVLALEAALLWGAVAARYTNQGGPLLASLLGFAMGAQNASIHQVGGVNIALTYVTGTLVRIGGAIAGAIRGEGSLRAVLPFIVVWLALGCGGLGAAAVSRRSEFISILAAAGAASVFVLWTFLAVWFRSTRRRTAA